MVVRVLRNKGSTWPFQSSKHSPSCESTVVFSECSSYLPTKHLGIRMRCPFSKDKGFTTTTSFSSSDQRQHTHSPKTTLIAFSPSLQSLHCFRRRPALWQHQPCCCQRSNVSMYRRNRPICCLADLLGRDGGVIRARFNCL